jgi:Outer membrane protein beta-barrel domain
MSALRRLALSLSILSLTPLLATAQEHGHVAGVYGWTFGDETASLYGAQFGVGLGGAFSIVGGVEKLDDVLTGRYALFLYDLSSLPGIDITAKIPATYYGAGLRWSFPGMTVKPYGQFEIGATSLRPEIAVALAGEDVTDEVFSPGELDTTATTIALSGGLRGDIGEHFLVEAGFKFLDIFTDQNISLNRINFAFGVRF